ncbi:hypothetical protein L6452_08161 [Arctium lappa]|uniref:Uncharacterized protein n=1 Tax=Arctium lappa TaxID=4217 RepID=A0ACB9DGK1_ARCLA|nr:hypothetical protein L6452_08161 [Arctium lappa]
MVMGGGRERSKLVSSSVTSSGCTRWEREGKVCVMKADDGGVFLAGEDGQKVKVYWMRFVRRREAQLRTDEHGQKGILRKIKEKKRKEIT